MAITNYDGIIAARAGGKGEDIIVAKTTAFGGVASQWYSSFRIAGSVPLIAPANINPGSIMNRASAGAFPLSNPTDPDVKQLLNWYASVSSITGFSALMLADLVWAGAGVNANINTLQAVNSPALTRYANGVGLKMVLCVTTALGATASNVTINYVNTADAAKSTAATAMTASCAVNRLQPVAGLLPFITLAAGDIGVKSITSIQFSAAMGAGVCDLYLFKPLHIIPTIAANSLVGIETPSNIDAITPLPKGSDNQIGCLGIFGLTNGATAATFLAMLRTCAG